MAEEFATTDRKRRKARYKAKLEKALDTYKNILVIGVDNVGSFQMQQVRLALRGRAEIVMGKNTIIRKVLRDRLAQNPDFEQLLSIVQGNIGFVFTNDNLNEVRKVILENKVPAAAKSNAIAPIDVYVPPGPTGLDPGQTSFFQALNIATKIMKGSIEIVNTVHLIHAGDKVSSSAVALLTKLNIKPFFYGITVDTVYENGSMYDAKILDMTDDDLLAKFFRGVQTIAAFGLATGLPSACSIPHSLINAFKKLVAIAVTTDYVFEEGKLYKDMIENPDAFKSGGGAGGAGGDEAKEEEKVEEEEESDEDLGGAGMFGDEEEGY
jgi:large subunit ribosomal protein LP0